MRSQLPNTVGDIGVNPGLVDSIPILADGNVPCLAFWYQGSLVGVTSFVMLLPETRSAVLVLTNTMAKHDAADWIGQLLVETLLDSHIRNDYASLARTSADRALEKYEELTNKVEEGRTAHGPARKLDAYAGKYVSFGGLFCIEVREGMTGLEILFQARESQKYQLKLHHENSFTWFMDWNEQIKRARFVSYQPALYSIGFRTGNGEGGNIGALTWIHDASIPEGDEFIKTQD